MEPSTAELEHQLLRIGHTPDSVETFEFGAETDEHDVEPAGPMRRREFECKGPDHVLATSFVSAHDQRSE